MEKERNYFEIIKKRFFSPLDPGISVIISALFIAFFALLFSFSKCNAAADVVSPSDGATISYSELSHEVSLTDVVSEPSEPVLPEGGKYIAFGDSITYCQLSTLGHDTEGKWQADSQSRIPNCIGKALGLDVVNKGIQGQGFYKNKYADGAIDYLHTCDLSGAKLITIAYGRNNSADPLGSSADKAGDKTICGQLKQCIEYVLANCGDAKVMIFGVTPKPGFDSPNAGGWTVTTLDAQYKLIAAQYGIGYADWEDCTITQNYSKYATADSVHPDSSDSYAKMGAYMAEKVSEYYFGK